jgi:hypothetical protein
MPSDPTEFIGRKRPNTRFTTVSKFDRRLKSLNRPTAVQEAALPPDTPDDEFITRPRTNQE